LVANKLFGLGYLFEHIQEFAIANLHKACQLTGAESKPRPDSDVVKTEGGGKAGEGGGGEVVRHYMHLFMALCAQRHELLHALIDAYVQASAGVRSAVQASSLCSALWARAYLWC
jgi:hypothetical protein